MKPGALALACLFALSPPRARAGDATLVLASRHDPYYSLAEEIARTEDLRIVGVLDDALAAEPEFLLWVVSPSRLSDRVVADVGLAINARRTVPSIGIISGSTIEQARALWRRAAEARGGRVYAVNGQYPAARVPDGRIFSFDPGETRGLTKAALVDSLRSAGYLTFTGHGGADYLSLAPGNAITAADIPDLPPAVIGTASCQTVRPWRPGSIALTFVDRGAAAFSGFVFSPFEGSLFGEFDGLPFRYTWDEFPIGHVVQVQTRGTLQGFAAFPYYLLLGDPRIAFGEAPPYRVTEDRLVGDGRVLTIAGAPAGVVPVRVAGAARYRFAEVPGLASAGDDDPFYNSRLQMADIGEVKYLLVRHAGGDFTLVLRPTAPAGRVVLKPLVDSLDAALVLLQPNGASLLATGVGTAVWLAIGWGTRKRARAGNRRVGRTVWLAALGIGLAAAALHGAYGWARLGRMTISEKPAAFDPLSVIGTFVLVAGAAFLYLRARSWLGRAGAVMIPIMPPLIGAAFAAAVAFAVNVASQRQAGADIYNQSLASLWLVATAFEVLLVGTAFTVSRRLLGRSLRGAS